MRRDFVVRDIVDGLYVLTPTAEDDHAPCAIPTVHFDDRPLPIGTVARIVFCEPVDPEVSRANGRYLGYPECCIEDFVGRVGRGSEEQHQASQGTGFVPCPPCARLVLEGKPLHELLLPTRRSPRPFTYPKRPAPV